MYPEDTIFRVRLRGTIQSTHHYTRKYRTKARKADLLEERTREMQGCRCEETGSRWPDETGSQESRGGVVGKGRKELGGAGGGGMCCVS